LAEGWYDSGIKQKADIQSAEFAISKQETAAADNQMPDEQDMSDDEFGPSLPSHSRSLDTMDSSAASRTRPAGPTIPSLQDLTHRNELVNSESRSSYFAGRESDRQERKAERSAAKSRMEELVPKSDGGTHERRVENARERATVQKSLGEARESGMDEVDEGELLGGEDGIAGFKKRKVEEERKKSDRAIRREEIARARAEEWKVKMQERKEKEDKTVDMLKELAKARYG
jgi:hypothetical protein